MTTIGERLKGFDKGWLWLILVAVALFGGGVAVGRFTLPAKVVITEKVHEVVKDRIVEKVKTEVQIVKVYLKNEAQKIHRVVEEKPDGTKTTTEDIGITTVINENTNSTEIKYVDRLVEKWQEKIVEKTKTVLNQPDWSVYAGAGVSVPYFLGKGERGIPGMMGAVVHAGIDRRVVGPFWIGVIGTTEGYVGGQLRVTW